MSVRVSVLRLLPGLAMAMLAPLAAGAQTQNETLASAIAATLEGNPDMLAQRKSREAADEQLKQAWAAMGPSLSLSGSYSALTSRPGQTFPLANGNTSPPSGHFNRDSIGLEARQSLYTSGAQTAQRAQAEAGVAAETSRIDVARQQLTLDAVAAFMDVRRSRLEASSHAENVQLLKTEVEAANTRFEAGEVTRTDVAQAESRYAGAQADEAAAQSQQAEAEAQYARIAGRSPGQLAAPPAAPSIPASLDAALAIARQENPQLAALRSEEEAARRAINVSVGALGPNLSIVGNLGAVGTHVDPTSYRDRDASVSLRLSIPLYSSGLLSSRTREARIGAEKAHYATLSRERLIVAQTARAWSAITAARVSSAASERRVAAAELAVAGGAEELKAGTRTTLDVLDLERELLLARIGLIRAQRDEYIAITQLLVAIGRLEPGLFDAK